MDGYTRWEEMWNRYKNFHAEERIRWHLENDCTCHVVEYWWNACEHFSSCPLENPDCEMWIFFEGVEEGFVFPQIEN